MQVIFYENEGNRIVEIIDPSVQIRSGQNMVELAFHPTLQGVRSVILMREHLSADFYDLPTGVAGDVLQKAVQYGIRIAIIGNFSDILSKSFHDLVRESNRGKDAFFVSQKDEARAKLFSSYK